MDSSNHHTYPDARRQCKNIVLREHQGIFVVLSPTFWRVLDRKVSFEIYWIWESLERRTLQ